MFTLPLHNLPWKYLYDASLNRFFALGVVWHNHPALHLAVLNTCEGARTAAYAPFCQRRAATGATGPPSGGGHAI